MACSSRTRVAIFGGLCTLLFSPTIRAQSHQEELQTCSPPCVSKDEFREITGKKVYPKIIVDDVRFDSPAHMPDSSDEPKVVSELKQHVFANGPEGLDEILETRIRGAWQEQGFFKVIATAQTQTISSDSAYEHVVVTIHVSPGQQY